MIPRTLVPMLLTVLMAGACGRSMPPAYEESRERWTSEVETYERMNARVFARATLETDPFVEEFVEVWGELFELEPDALAEKRRELLEEHRTFWVVRIAVFTNRLAWDDLTTDSEVWNIKLVGSDGAALPLHSAERLDYDDPVWERLFPYLTDFDTFWKLRFEREAAEEGPIAESGDRVELVIAGAPTEVRMHWTVP